MAILFSNRLRSARIALRASIAAAPILAMSIPAVPVMAAPLASSTVNACAGSVLPASVVTNIVKPVIEGITTPLQARTNLLAVNLNLLGLSVNTALAIDTTNLINTANTAVDTILAPVATTGSAFVPGNGCFSQATGFTLANTGGISVGGNQITGLGNGTVASAGHISAIAFGNGATTDAAATGAVALGTAAQVGTGGIDGIALGRNANVSVANSLALGAGTSALRGALTNYSAVGLTGLQNSVGEVSVGATGALRQVTNLAAGSDPTDAVNVGQLTGVANNLATLTASATQYDGSDHARLTLNGLNGTVLANVKAGVVGAGSTEAVNGGQLYTVAQDVLTNAGSISQLRADVNGGALGTVRYSATGALNLPNGGTLTNDVALVGASLGAVGLHNVASGTIGLGSADAVNGGQLYTVAQDVLTNAGSISQLRADVNGGALGTLRYSATGALNLPNGGTPTNDVALVGASLGAVGLHNVASGTIGLGSADAVNGGQLYTVAQDVLTNAGSISQLRADVNGGALGAVRYSATGALNLPNGGTPTNDVALVGASLGAVGLHNVAAGTIAIGSSDAVNGSQLALTNAALDAATTALGTQISGATGATTTLRNDVANGLIGILRFSDPLTPTAPNGGTPTQSATLVGGLAGTVTLHNVGAATIAAGSTDAVNGDQLYTVQQTAATTAAGLATLGGTVAGHTQTLAQVQASLLQQGQTAAQQGTDLTALQGEVATQGTTLTLTAGQLSTLRSDTENGAIGPVRYSNLLTPTVPNGGTVTGDLTLVGTAGSSVRLHNLADGAIAAGSTDAVNGGQLFTTNANVATLRTDVDANTAQLAQLGGEVSGASNSLVQLSANVQNGAVGPVRYSDALSPTIANGGMASMDLTLVGAQSGPVGLHNVAMGVLGAGSTDVVNGGQMFGMGTSLANALGLTFNPATASFSGNFTFGGTTYNNIQTTLGAIYNSVAVAPTSSGTSQKYFHTTSVLQDSQAAGADSTAIGPDAMSGGVAAVATGRSAMAMSDGSVAIGDNAQAQSGKAVSIGFANVSNGDGAVAIGDPNIATGDGAIALGKDNTGTGQGAIALGFTNVANGDGSVAIGRSNNANGDATTTIGDSNVANGQSAFAVGNNNEATGVESLAIGSNNIATGAGAMSIGRNIWNAADDTLAIGEDTKVTFSDAIAVGNRASAMANNATALGNDSAATAENSIAIGNEAQATGLGSSAIGIAAKAGGLYSFAAGASTSAQALGGLAVGYAATADAYAGTALGSGSAALHDGSVALGTATATVRGAVANYSAFGLDDAQTSGGEVAIARNVVFIDATTGLPTQTGNRQITGLAAGSADTDAVNVSQLRGVSTAISTALVSGLGGGATYDAATGRITGPTYSLNGATYGDVGDALYAIAAQVGIAAPPAVSGGTSGSSGGSGGSGSGGTGGNGAGGGGTGQANAPVQYSTGGAANGTTTTPSNDVTLVGADTTRAVALHNVANGQIASGSTDAVNGGQLAQVSQVATAAQSTATQALTVAAGGVRYDNSAQTSVTLGSADTPVAVHNVADGTSAHDAVNVGQLQAGMESAVTTANAYTDQKVAALSFDLRKFNRNANAGTAGAMATAGMPQAFDAGRGMIAGSVGTYGGEGAIALGFSRMGRDGRSVLKAGATYNSRGKVGASAGFGFQL